MSLIVAIEGGDACGKATQTKLLAERLGGTRLAFPDYEQPAGKAILGHLKNHWKVMADLNTDGPVEEIATNTLVFQSLMTVNRLEMLPVINALRAAGRPIVFDRYSASGTVYGTLDGLDPNWLELINASLPQPDVWILLDVPVEEGFKRRPERRDRIEQDREYLEKVRAGYLELFEKRRSARAQFTTVGEPKTAEEGRWIIVDGTGTIEEVQTRIWKVIEWFVRGDRR